MESETKSESERQLEEAKKEIAYYRRIVEEAGNARLRENEELSQLLADRRGAEEALKAAHEQLEEEVKKRTAEISVVNSRLLVNQDRLRILASQLLLAEERERRRIAMEVHDHIGQNLAYAKMKLDQLRLVAPADCSTAVGEVIELIQAIIHDTRSLVSELGSPVLYELGLAPAVQWLTQQVRQAHGLQVVFQADGIPTRTSHDINVFVFQAVRELLANVAKYARASKCVVSLGLEKGKIRVDVVDDGIGFDIKKVGSVEGKGKGFGFFSIRERLEPLGGSMDIDSAPGKGTRVTLLAPLLQEQLKEEG